MCSLLNLNKEESELNINTINILINKLNIIKSNLKECKINISDLDILSKYIIKNEEKLFTNIKNSHEEIRYNRPYLKKGSNTYCISISPNMANLMGITPEFRRVVFILDNSSKRLIVKKYESIDNLSNYKSYLASKSKNNKYGTVFNLCIPGKYLNAISADNNSTLVLRYSKDKLIISTK